jgi:hypothetical protein
MVVTNTVLSFPSVQITVDDYDSQLSKAKTRSNIDLTIELDYMGCLEIESKYLQKSIIMWLIGQLKYYELNQHRQTIRCEISAENNLFCGYNNNRSYSSYMNYENDDIFLFKHKLTQIFKLTHLIDDKQCFGYFYRETNSLLYKLFLFKSKQTNMIQEILQFQHKAFKLKQSQMNKLATRAFPVELIGEVSN